jgi:hypothetical protein
MVRAAENLAIADGNQREAWDAMALLYEAIGEAGLSASCPPNRQSMPSTADLLGLG